MTTTSPTTELEAINTMLSVIGESPVNQLSTATNADARIAVQILNEISRDFQLQGWHFNTEPNFPLPRNATGEIVVSSAVVRVDISASLYPSLSVTQRGNKLYDRNKHTYIFTADLVGECVFLLDFAEMPEAARRYVTLRASRIFQDRVVGSNELARSANGDEMMALGHMKAFDAATADHSIFDASDILETLDRY